MDARLPTTDGVPASPAAARAPSASGAPAPKRSAAAAIGPALSAGAAAAGEALRELRAMGAADRFFKYKVLVVGLWVLLGGAGIYLAFPSAQRTPANALSAHVKLQRERLLDYTALYVENAGEADWTDVTLKLNGAFVAAVPVVAAGHNVVIDVRKFTGPDGRTIPRDVMPRTLELHCNLGEARLDLR